MWSFLDHRNVIRPRYAIKNILASTVDEVIIVLGDEQDLVKNAVGVSKKIKFAYNKDYEKGISFSIKTGLNHISKKSEAFFISLGDMPDINQNIYNKLIKSRLSYNKKLQPQHKKEIIIPTFEGKNGNPILFSKFMKQKVMLVKNDMGANEIIKLNKEKILKVPFDNDGIFLDFDTPDSFNSS